MKIIKTKRKPGKVFRIQDYAEPYDPVTDTFLDFDLEGGSLVVDLGYDNDVGERFFLFERGLVLLDRFDYTNMIEIGKKKKKRKERKYN